MATGVLDWIIIKKEQFEPFETVFSILKLNLGYNNKLMNILEQWNWLFGDMQFFIYQWQNV